MIYAVVALALAVIGLIGYLVHSSISDAHAQGDARVAQVATEAHLEREQYEHEVTKKALDATTKRAMALEEALAHALDQPFPDAAPGDWRARVLRLANQWREADGAGALPAEPDGAVSDDSAAAKAPATAGVLADPFTEPVP